MEPDEVARIKAEGKAEGELLARVKAIETSLNRLWIIIASGALALAASVWDSIGKLVLK